MYYINGICESPGIKTKMKKKEFERNVNRDDIINGAEGLGIPLEEHIGFVLNAIKGISGKLGL